MLAPHGLAYLAARIHEHYGDRANEILRANPYELTSVFGVGFMIADRIATASGAARRPRSARAPRSCTFCPSPSAAAARACRSERC